MSPSWIDDLNAEQRRAVTHEGGPLLVVAGAGTGKTRTLASRVAWLVERGASPERILLLTFTRRAAREMLARSAALIRGSIATKPWGGTFHAVANRILRAYGRATGLDPSFTILDQTDAADLFGLAREELGFGRGKRRFPRKETLAAIYSRMVNAGSGLTDLLEQHFPWCREELEKIRATFVAYTERKRRQNLVDYDDLLLFWNAAARNPASAERVVSLFDHVLVDEYQDTNSLQADILEAMASGTPNLTVVGDDAQAIYSFRAATHRNILEFPSRFAGTTVVTLEQSYRSTMPILAASNAVIALAPKRHVKTLRSDRTGGHRPQIVTCLDERQQCDAVCDALLELREQGIPLRRQVVLFRAGHHSDLLEIELGRRNIPFVKYGGLRFLEAAHVKDLIALLRVLENPRDEVAWFRVLQMLDGVGPSTTRRILDTLGTGSDPTDTGPASPVERLLASRTTIPALASPAGCALREALCDCLAPPGGPEPAVAVQVERLRVYLEPILERRYEGAASRIRDLEQLATLAAGCTTRERFLADLTLDPPASTEDLAGPPHLDDDVLTLSTIHSAKGCEWDAVHVIHAADGNIPSDMATGRSEDVEEERRLFYVALTRARNALSVYFPRRYDHRPGLARDDHSYAQLTRFLPPEVRVLFDERSLVEAEDDPAAMATAAGSTAPVDERLRDLWGR